VGGLVPYEDRVRHVARIGVVFGQRSQLWWDLPVLDGFDLLADIYRVEPAHYRRRRDELVAMLRQLGAVSECAVVSFHHPSIRVLREMEQRLQLGILEGARPIDPARMLKESGADIFSPHWGAMDTQLVKEIHAAGGGVAVWPVDDDTAVAWCKLCKPDGIFTNRPVEIGAALRA